MISTIFLDNDGVLADTEKYYFEANVETCRRHGYDLTRTEYQRLFLAAGSGLREVSALLGWTDEKLAAVRAERDARYRGLLETRDIALPGVEQGLARLGARFRLCVVTSSPRQFFDIIHCRTGFSRYFDRVISEENVERHKPDPDPYLKAISAMRIRPEEGIAIEDSGRGMKSAAAAGLACIIVPRELTADQDFAGAAGVVATFTDAVELINKREG